MAYQLSELRTLALERAGFPDDSTFVSAAELGKYVNDAYKDLWAYITTVYGPNATADYTEKTTTAGIATVALPVDPISGEPQVEKILRVAVLYNDYWFPLEPFNFAESIVPNTARDWNPGVNIRYRYRFNTLEFVPTPSSVYTVRIWFLWRCFPLINDSDEVDTMALPFQDYIVIGAAIRCLRKQRSDTSELMAEKAALEARIQAEAASVDAGMPERAVDIETMRALRSWGESWEY